jgi:D-alanyl-lipoteichoic acid acyltransferase DltB (MBOAT superfamily)
VDDAAYAHPDDAVRARRKWWLVLSLISNLSVLGFFKYFNFFVDSVHAGLTLLGMPTSLPVLQVVLPVGISFYTFQSLSYTIDVYRGRLRACRSLLDFALFVAFFPQLVAGPIERAEALVPRVLSARVFNLVVARDALVLMAWGFFKKLVIADRLAIYVNDVYGDPQNHNGLQLTIATVFFAYQIYCDFSGYSDIAIGTARVLGFKLMENFDRPYASRSVSEFWRRWHISLSNWFRDYLYVPLGGNRRGRVREYANLVVVFLLCGLWHGASWPFVLWGAWHGAFLVIERAGFGRAPVTSRCCCIELALSITIGVRDQTGARASRRRMARAAARPSMTGICMSISTMSKPPREKASTASAPVSTGISSTPKGARISSTTRRFTGWSSASSTRSSAKRWAGSPASTAAAARPG